MKCKYCGEEFEQNKRGRKKEYCNKIECIRKARNDANKKWYVNKLKALTGAKVQIVKAKESKQDQKVIIYSSKDKTDTKIQMPDVSDILQLSREFGTLRYNLICLLQKENEQVEKFNKQDQTFLHKLEFLEELSDEDATKMIIEEKKSRELRRNTKNRKYLIEAMLNAIKMKNPNAFMIKAIQGKGDIRKTIANLKEDESLYIKNKEEVLGIKEV